MARLRTPRARIEREALEGRDAGAWPLVLLDRALTPPLTHHREPASHKPDDVHKPSPAIMRVSTLSTSILLLGALAAASCRAQQQPAAEPQAPQPQLLAQEQEQEEEEVITTSLAMAKMGKQQAPFPEPPAAAPSRWVKVQPLPCLRDRGRMSVWTDLVNGGGDEPMR